VTDSVVVVFDLLYRKHPVGHITGSFEKDQQDGFHHSRMATLCGQVVHEMIWIEHREKVDGVTEYHQAVLDETKRGTYLRREHLVQIGRVCKRCEAAENSSSREADR
jgi:hypothetical protein